MNHDYVAQATRTESIRFEMIPQRLLHAAIGISTEIMELAMTREDDPINIKEELGDVLWYTALIADSYYVSYDKLVGTGLRDMTKAQLWTILFKYSGELLDRCKKALFYGAEIRGPEIVATTSVIVTAIASMAELEGFTIGEVQNANIEKLKVRYPDKFTSKRALERNITFERTALDNPDTL